MVKKQILGILVAFMGSIGLVWSQQAMVVGKVTDFETGEGLEGATVRLFADSTIVAGTLVDVDGSYQIKVSAGTYRLVVSYVSYEEFTVDGLKLLPGQNFTQNAVLGVNQDDTGEKNTVLITGKVIRNNETALLTMQRRSTSVMDAISMEQVKRSGDNDAASAIKRVTGITVEGGKYIYVRGLGDRYSKTLLNGAEIPGLDPNRNSVQMDMFPSTLIDNLVVYKTFSPDMPGSFSGGLVKINTKDFPQSLTLSASSSVGYNTVSSLQDGFMTGDRGKWDWLGFDDGTRALPDPISRPGFVVPDLSFSNAEDAMAIDAATKSFDSPIFPTQGRSGLNQSHAFSIGDQKTLLGKPLGLVASLSYSNNQIQFADYKQGRWMLVDMVDSTDNLNPQVNLAGSQSTSEVLWGALAGLSYQIHPNHQISFNYLHNQSGNQTASYLTGGIPKDDANVVIETRTLGYTQRSMDAFQLKGDHKSEKLQLDWISAVTRSSQDEPDLRFFTNDYTREDSVYDIQRNLYTAPSRYFRNMDELNLDLRLNLALNFKQWSGMQSVLKFGLAETYKARSFAEKRFEFVNNNPSGIQYNGNPGDYWAEENLGVLGQDHNGLYQYGIIVSDVSELRNSYDGTQMVTAGYAMTELPLNKRLRMVGGARVEHTLIGLQSLDRTLEVATLNNLDLLPSMNLIYAVGKQPEKQGSNLRGSFSRTLARPVFRELAPFASFDFVGDMVLVGNPQLERTLIDNYDLRWEWFPSVNEIVSVSAFYKNFHNPIELVVNPMAANFEGNFRNVDQAQLVGAEFEFRKHLGFLSPALEDLRASGNLTVIYSRQTIAEDELAQIRALNPAAEDTRAMFGQSPYSANGELAYVNDSLGFSVGANFNVFGPRISAVSRGGTPNVLEMPRPTLDASLTKTFAKRWTLTLRARNLLDPEIRKVHPYKGQEFVFSSYRLGRSFSVGIGYSFQ
jgi:hypothetical protein